jgi:hypothetical protein
MKNVNTIAAILVAVCAVSIAADPAAAAKKKQKRQLSSIDAIKLTCLKQIGATRQGGYYYTQGGVGTAQQQAYYNCLDAHTMNRR